MTLIKSADLLFEVSYVFEGRIRVIEVGAVVIGGAVEFLYPSFGHA